MIVTSISEYQDVTAETTWHPVQLPANFSRMYYVQGGEAYYFDTDQSFRFRHGFLYLLPAGKEYRMQHNPKDPINHLYCHIVTSPRVSSVIEIPVEENTLLMDTLLLLKKNIKNRDFSVVLKMVDLLLSSVDASAFANEYSGDISFTVKMFIDNHFEEDISLEDICKKFHFSKSYILKSFKKIHNISPIQYLIQKRLEASINYLKSGTSIKNISEKLHYSSPSNFSLSFKKYYGVSPVGYLDSIERDKINSLKYID